MVGPLAGSVADVAALGAVLAGDPALRSAASGPVAGRTVALLAGAEDGPAAPAAGALREAGVGLVTISSPILAETAAIHAVIQPSEAAAVHACRWPEQEYAPEVRERLEAGRRIPAWRYLEARRARRRLVAELFAAMADAGADALLVPTTAGVAPLRDGDPARDRADLLRYAVPLTQTGGPVLAVPAARDSVTGLPLGVQLAGPPGSEALLLALGARIEQARPEAAARGLGSGPQAGASW